MHHSVLRDYWEVAGDGRQLVLMPISRFQIEDRFHLGPFTFYPAGEVDFEELRVVPNYACNPQGEEAVRALEGQQLREILTAHTGITLSILAENTLVAFPACVNWPSFLRSNHREDIQLIRRLSEQAERAMALIRFHFCHLYVPDTLPGRVGTWEGSGPYCSALLFNYEDHESYLIAGAAITSSIVVKGMGLNLDDWQCQSDLRYPDPGEVGSIAQHALSLYSEALEANSDTVKFTRVMTLLEFLASPDTYQQMKKAKTSILVHVASSKGDYDRLCERFRELTSKTDQFTGAQIGIRTLIVHHGRYLEDIVPDDAHRVALLRELEEYCVRVLNDMLNRSSMTWVDFQRHRDQLKTSLGIGNPSPDS